MQSPIRSVLNAGSGGVIVDVECHLSNSLPGIVIVGLGSKAVDEARERVRSAFASCRIPMPRKRITINLAPADVPKESTGLDLAIALAILQTDGKTPITLPASCAVIGELGLDGRIRAVRGLIGKLLTGKQLGIDTFFIPKDNLAQALLVPDVTLMPAESLSELTAVLTGHAEIPRHIGGSITIDAAEIETSDIIALEDIAGQDRAKRALIIAAAGGHNLLLSGPPGTGKSMLAKACRGLLPPPSRDEMLEITHLYSLADAQYEKLCTSRPFRAPHHTTSYAAMVGGGARLRPGEVSLSHKGVLFLDELPEFGRQTIEALRQPLEDRIITVSRARERAEFPADFILIATANPCPCGFYGSSQPCVCSQFRIAEYHRRLSGPVIDRIDLYVETEETKHESLLTKSVATNDIVYMQIDRARQRQQKRYNTLSKLNATMDNSDIRRYANITPDATSILNKAAERLHLSARSYMRTIKVARTIADLEQRADIERSHITEALQYRPPHRQPLD